MAISWSLHTAATGYKVVKATVSNAKSGTSILISKNSGQLLTRVSNESSFNAIGQHYLSTNIIYISIPDNITDFSSYFLSNPHSLHYQLAKPIEEVATVEGSLSAHSGGNVFEGSSGVVMKEKVIPASNGAGLRYINRGDHVVYETSKLKLRADKIFAVYKNKAIDKRWIIQTDGTAYGKQRAQITEADFDSTADYYVTYMPLDRYGITANLAEVKLEYAGNLGTTVSHLVRDMTDNQAKDTVQDWLLLQDGAYLDNLRFDIDAHGAQVTGVHGATAANTANRLVQRDANGRAQFGDPVSAQDVATKAWVEAQIALAKTYAP